MYITGDLLALRARQLERRDENLKKAVLHLQRVKTEEKEYFDQRHRFKDTDLEKRDLVL